MDPVLVWRFAGGEQPWRISSNEHGRAYDQVSVALAQVRTASGQVLTPPFRPIRDVVIVRRKRVLSLSVFFTMRLRNLISWLIHVMALSLKQLRCISARAFLCARATAFS